jgi:superfamily II DNA/RNA helicase
VNTTTSAAPDAPSEVEPGAPSSFSGLGLRPELVAALAALGYEEPTPIQHEAIPPVLAGRDLLGQAATGTGKTAAFALPDPQRLDRGTRSDDPMALVLVPTRELAMQVSEAVHKYGRDLGARVLPIYGGPARRPPARGAQARVDIVVATPGRALDLIGRGVLKLARAQLTVLDEADEMLDMGFADDIEAILEGTPDGVQTVLFSATMPPAAGQDDPPLPRRPGRGSRSRARRCPRATRRSCARPPTSSSAPTRPPRSAACSTSRRRPRRSSSAGPAPRSTGSPTRSTGAATVRRRCTAG